MVIGRGLFLSLSGQIPIRQGNDLFSKFHVRPEGFSFDRPRKSDEGTDTDLIYIFCWLYLDSRFTLRIPSNIVFSSEGTLWARREECRTCHRLSLCEECLVSPQILTSGRTLAEIYHRTAGCPSNLPVRAGTTSPSTHAWLKVTHLRATVNKHYELIFTWGQKV